MQLLLDGSDSNTAGIALGYAESLVRDYSLELRSRGHEPARRAERWRRPVDARLRVWYNSSLESKNYVVPGLIAVVLQIIAALLTSLTIAREWEMGTMEQIISTPLRPAEMVLGKMLAYFGVGVADSTIAMVVGIFIFQVPFRGSLLLLTASICIFLFGALFWGIFVSAAARTQVQAYQMGILSSFLPAFLLSGFIYSIENMPWVIRVITHIVPARYVVTILKGIFLKGTGSERVVGRIGVPDAVRGDRVRRGHAQAEPETGVTLMWERIRVILRKEFIQALREPRMRLLLFVPPIMQLLIFGFAVNLDVDQARIAWMDMDRTPASRDLRDRFTGSGRFEIVATPDNEEQVQRVLDRDVAQAVVRVLPGFARDLARGRPAQVQVLVDGTNSNTASIVSNYAGRSDRRFFSGPDWRFSKA